MPESSTSGQPHQSTTPLGGSANRATRSLLTRHWGGYVAMVRPCPACGYENLPETVFCGDCGADLRGVEEQPASSEQPGLQAMQARRFREERRSRRSRDEDTSGGGGWILASPFLLVPAIVLSSNTLICYGLWLAGIASALLGFWRIRRDSGAIRGWGIVLGILTAFTFSYLGIHILQTKPPVGLAQVAGDATATPPTLAEVVATPPASGRITTDVLAFRGDSGHSGVQPGPPPTGNPRLAWRFDTGGEVYSTPVIADGMLFVTSKRGELFALNAETGAEIWRYQVSPYVVRSSPVVANGMVYVGGGFNLVALDLRTGDVRWKAATRYAGQATPVVGDGLVVIASQEGWLYAFDAKSGEARWRVTTDGIVSGAPAIADGRIILGTDKGSVYTVALDSSSLGWRRMMAGAISAAPMVTGQTVCITTDAGKTSAFDLATGKVLWTAEIGGTQPAAAADGLVVIAANDGGVHAVSQSSGDAVWLYPSGKPSLAAPTIAGKTVYVGAGNTLVAIDAGTGKLENYYLANGTIVTSPVVVDGFVFFGSDDGFVYAVTSGE